MMFDTHKYIKLLTSQGLKEPQAESIIQALSDSREFDLSRLVTKELFATLKESIVEIKREMATKAESNKFRQEIKEIKDEMATKAELNEVKEEIKEVKQEIKEIREELKNGMKWVLGLVLGSMTLILTVIGLIAAFVLQH